MTSSSDPPNAFLRTLVDAMRDAASEARDRAISELRASVDDAIGRLRTASEQRAAAMRELAEEEIAAIAAWQEAEIERVRAEARRRADERRAAADREIDDDARRTEAEIDSLKRSATEDEAELDRFLVRLSGIADPAAFVAEAQRMPQPRTANRAATPPPGTATEAAAPQPTVELEPEAEPAAPEPAAPQRAAPEPAAPESPAGVDPRSAAEAGEAVEASDDDTATLVVVKGLVSFGAITTFKQGLERAPGIRSVTLSLGPSGEFVYRARHEPGTDVAAALGALDGGGRVERQPDGSLRITVGPQR